MLISVLFTSSNEVQHGFLFKALDALIHHPHCEFIVVDHKSQDGTLEKLQSYPVQVIPSLENTRAGRFNQAINAARGDVILLHHPRSLLAPQAIKELLCQENYQWGGFTHQFNAPHPLLEFTSWYSNFIRFDKKHIVYLDHCLFFKRELVDCEHFIPPVDIFEDTELSKKLQSFGPPLRLTGRSLTSSIRFQKNGFFRQALLNQLLKIGYILGVPKKSMNRWYEMGLSLNSRY